jgi:menaquinone-dependent protoporphyrinogen oxidase
MRFLVVYGSKRGGTAGIATMIADALNASGHVADVRNAGERAPLGDYDAVLVGGSLYGDRWHKDARRFIKRNTDGLRRLPVWLFSSGPLNESAREDVPPVSQVRVLLARIGARGHVTFGGRLLPDAKGFIASRMARTHAGDWRDEERIRAWALACAAEVGPPAAHV